MTTEDRGIRVVMLEDGRCTANLDDVSAVGYESSLASQARGEDPISNAVRSLRRVYDRLPEKLPIRVYGLDGMTPIGSREG